MDHHGACEHRFSPHDGDHNTDCNFGQILERWSNSGFICGPGILRNSNGYRRCQGNTFVLSTSGKKLHLNIRFSVAHTKVDVPRSATSINRTHLFELFVVRCGSKNGHQKNMCLKDIGLHAPNMLTFLGSIVRERERASYMTVQWAQESSLW